MSQSIRLSESTLVVHHILRVLIVNHHRKHQATQPGNLVPQFHLRFPVGHLHLNQLDPANSLRALATDPSDALVTLEGSPSEESVLRQQEERSVEEDQVHLVLVFRSLFVLVSEREFVQFSFSD